MPIRRLSRETIGQRGVEIYESKLRSVLDPAFRGSFVAIDVETEDYEVADDAAEAENRLWTRHPDAQVLVERIGYPAAFSVGGARELA